MENSLGKKIRTSVDKNKIPTLGRQEQNSAYRSLVCRHHTIYQKIRRQTDAKKKMPQGGWEKKFTLEPNFHGPPEYLIVHPLFFSFIHMYILET